MLFAEKEENPILLKYLLSSLLRRVISIQINSGAQSDTVPVGDRGAAWEELKAFVLPQIHITRTTIPSWSSMFVIEIVSSSDLPLKASQLFQTA